MELVFFIFIFLFGLIIGSFLNALSFRLNSGVSMVGRSKCMVCSTTLEYYDLFPVFSFALLRGKCRYCKTGISFQYPLIELLTAIVFTLSFLRSGLPEVFFWWILWSVLITISIYDFRHKIIPDSLVLLFGLLSFAGLLLGFSLVEASLINILAGPILAIPFAFLWLVSQGRWMGLGDAKLAIGIGWILGLSLGSSAIVLSFWIGAVVAIFLMFLSRLFELNGGLKELRMNSEVPFGPFMILATFIVYYFSIDVFGLSIIFGF